MPRRSVRERKKQYRPHPIITQLAILAQLDPRTQQELYDEDGISRETWRSWETGRRSPGLDGISVRAATLGRKITLTTIDPPPEDRQV